MAPPGLTPRVILSRPGLEMPIPIHIDYYTDPLCSWCFAAEPMLDQVREHFKGRIELQNKLLPLFEELREVMNNPARLWNIADRYRIVSKKTGIYINETVWYRDPPASAWIPCQAVKAAERQDRRAADRFLKRLRIAVLLEGRNIARREVLMECAAETGLELARFEADFLDPARRDEVARDVADAQKENVESRPTFILTNTQVDKVLIAGPRSFELFRQGIEALYQEQPEL